ncbi:hypothetical protein [Nitrosopumilus sp.]|uniref:hypothetical protein n=1 Tax=Nitrosopumilus sp. TaxID=2024843 RepID=UPI002606F43C|nr:hypothetical protein [Nitrosopumilus sp.]
MKTSSYTLIGLVLTLVLISFQIEAFAENDSIFPQWIRQTTEIWVKGDITDAEYLALIENVLNNNILPIEIVDEINLKHTAKMVVKDIPELSQNVDIDLIPLWTKDRAQWWVEGKITDEQFLRTIHVLRESGYLEYTPEKSYFTQEQTFQSSLEKYLLTEKEILNIIKQTKWRILSTEYEFEEKEGVMDSVRIMFTDITRVYDPAFYQYKVPSLILQIAEFNDQNDLANYWNSFDRNNNATIFETSYLSTDLNENSQCFFDYKINGAMTSCSYENMIFHVVIFDEYAEHYDYNKNEINLDETEPTTRFASEILNKINFFHNDNVNTLLHKTMQKETIPETVEEPELPQKVVPKSVEPETSSIQGVENFSCTKDDFGLVTVSGMYNNDNIKRDQVDLIISFYDKSGEILGKTGTTFYDLEEFEVKRFLGHTKWNGNFHNCQIEIN